MANIEIRQETPTAFYIKVHDTDNVAIIVNDNGLKAGTRFPDGLELIEHIPQGHKVALLDIPANGEIIRYGEVGSDSNLLIVFYVQIMPDDLVMQLHR
ncbi:SAF domain-containing protein, partial [Escherichia coli]